jgi:flagellar biosynthesis GTPase FlhF
VINNKYIIVTVIDSNNSLMDDIVKYNKQWKTIIDDYRRKIKFNLPNTRERFKEYINGRLSLLPPTTANPLTRKYHRIQKKSTQKKSASKNSTQKKSTDKKSEEKKSTEKKSEEKKTEEKKSEDKKSTVKKSEDKKTAEKKTAEKKTAEKKTADKKTAEKKTAYKSPVSSIDMVAANLDKEILRFLG